MSLKLLTGPKRSGKTGRIMNELKKSPENSYLIVPEQTLFFYETKILEELKEKGAFLCQTLSFLKLSLKVCEEQENFTSLKLLDNETINMILASVILEHRKELKLFKGGDKSDYREQIKSQISELRKHLVRAEDLYNLKNSNNIPEVLKNKLSDLFVIMSAYEKRCENVFSDSDGLMAEAAEQIIKTKYFKGKKIFIDGFTGFTPEELMIIKAMDESGGEILISLDYTNKDGKYTGDIYSSVKLSVNKLSKMFPSLEITELSGCDVKNKEINHLCMNMFTREEEYKEVPENIHLFKYKNPYGEAEAISALVADMIDKGASPAEFQIVAKDGIKKIAAELEKYGIPCYTEKKTSVSEFPLYALVSCVFDLVMQRPSSDLLVNYIKNFCIFSDENIFLFENFVYSSGLKGWQFLKDKGFEELIESAYNFDYSKEKEIRWVYEEYIKPLISLKKRISAKNTANHYAVCLYDFFNEIKLLDMTVKMAEEFEKDGKRVRAIEYVSVYNAFVEILERCALMLKNEELGFKDFKSILFDNFSEKNISSLPLESECVYLSEVADVAPGVFPYVCLVSANDGLIGGGADGFINESERAVLKEMDLELSISPSMKKCEEYLKIFTLLTSAEKKLFVSYSAFNTKGEETIPSDIIDKLKKVFPALKETSELKEIYTDKTLISSGIEKIRTNDIKKGKMMIRQALGIEKYSGRVSDAISFFGKKPVFEIKLSGVDDYIKDELKLSVTALEKYRSCGFSYYVKYILKGKEKDIFSVDNAGIGLLLHMVMQRFSEQVKKEGRSFSDIDDSYIDEKLDKIVDRSVKEVNSGLFEMGGRASFMVKKVKRDSRRTLKMLCEHFKKGEFTEHAFELSFGREGDPLSGMEINLSKGRKIILSGTIDRVDTFKRDDAEYIRVVDYKSTMKTLDLYEIYYGLNIQLITYLMVVLKSDIERKLLPGGVMYLSLENPMISVKNPENTDRAEAEIRKKLIMKGLFLNDPEIMSKMDKELLASGKSEIIEVEFDKDNEISKGSVLSIAEFEAVFEKLKNNIREMAEGIYGGEFKIRPVSNNGKSKCEYCPYSPICCFDENVFSFEEIKKEPFDRVMEKIKEGE